jgi:hypothetical protein
MTLGFALIITVVLSAFRADAAPNWQNETSAQLERELVATWGAAQQPAIQRGLRQVGQFWREDDGSAAVFAAFVRDQYAGDPAVRDAQFDRFQRMSEMLSGHLTELRYELKLQTDLDRGPVYPFDELFSAYDPGAHLADDFFQTKLAFVVLLNFPLTTLEQRLSDGERWSRRQWAEARLALSCSKRVPAAVQQAMSDAQAEAELYINEYKIWMHHLLDTAGQRPFPAGMKLITHWNLRDEIKSQYADPKAGLARQRLIQQVMERIINQSIPQAVINNPGVDWDPVANTIKLSAERDGEPLPARGSGVTNQPEGGTRYAKLLRVFQTCRQVDPFSPTAPTLIARRFEEDRQMPEARVQGMLEQVLRSPQMLAVGRLIAQRLGRPLEPFDIWYDGFRPRETYPEAQLDEMIRKRYPTATAYRADMPHLLNQMGFSPERATMLQSLIDVEASRGTGHAMGGGMRGQKARLRTRVEAGGMNFKGFNIALHEMGHNIEQTFSMNLVDYPLLAGVPNNMFTEALAMVIQARDFELLGLAQPDARSERLRALGDFWATAEIAGVALVDMGVWHWMYDHPQAQPAELQEATLKLARSVWNQFFAPVFVQKDVTLLAIYSHMIRDVLYLPDYPVGHLIARQIEEHVRKSGSLALEFERMAKYGNVAPDLWMKNATGAPVGAEAMLAATQQALTDLNAPSK